MFRVAYRGLGCLFPFKAFTKLRLLAGKEDPSRLEERFGYASRRRPQGFLLWAHAVSVGEAALLMPLLAYFIKSPRLTVLLTTNTLDSAKFVKKFAPSELIHQFICWDSPRFVGRFLRHWRPNLVVWAESELWPNMVLQTAQVAPLVLANGHLSPRSYRRWRFFNRLFGNGIFTSLSECLAQNREQAEYFTELGVPKVIAAGNLKYGAQSPPPTRHLADFKKLLRGRKVWAALSTHPGEEEKLLRAQRLLKDRLLIIIPRHPNRGPKVRDLAASRGFAVALRSETPQPNGNCQVYVADTLGEVGLWCRLAKSVFIGGTWVNLGGHNPLEALNCGVTSLSFGRNTRRFAELFDELEAGSLGFRVDNPEQLARVINSGGNNRSKPRLVIKLRSRRRKILRTYINRLSPYIDDAKLR